MEVAGRVRTAAPRALLLPRARTVFATFLLVALALQQLVLFGVSAPWWPDRAVGLVAVAVVAAWCLDVVRSQRTTLLGDAALVAALVAAGLSGGAEGSVLLLLFAVVPLRALYGGRRGLVLVVAGLLVGFGTVAVVAHGGATAVEFLIVAAVLVATAATLRRVVELLAEHDLRARLDAVATEASAALVGATTTAEVDEVEEAALAGVAEHRSASERAPLPRPVATPVPDRITGHPDDADRAGSADPVAAVLRRLASDTFLARQRVGSEARYRAVAEGSRDGVYLRTTDPQPRYHYLNPAAEALLGASVADVARDRDLVPRAIHPDDIARVVGPITDHGHLPDVVEVRLRSADGRERWVALQERPVDVDGDDRTVLGTVTDVTHHHETESALQRIAEREHAAAEELRHVDAMKSTFLQAVSHELRTPLSAVIGAAQTLDQHDGAMDGDQRRRMLDIVQRQSGRLERLLTDLLDVDRLSRGLVTPHRRPVDLHALAAGVLETLEGEADRIELVGDPVVLRVDGPKVERIVENLLRNALRHTPPDPAPAGHASGRSGGYPAR